MLLANWIPSTTWLVKLCCDVLAPVITEMVNLSLCEGIVRDYWKTALVLPFLKKLGLDLIFKNFRPVSNLPFVAKSAEKVVISQLSTHCAVNAPLPENQSSYREHHYWKFHGNSFTKSPKWHSPQYGLGLWCATLEHGLIPTCQWILAHIGKVCSKAFRSLYDIRQIKKFLSKETTKILVHAFVTSHLDYCNSLLYGLPQYQYDRLQRVLNAAARVVCFVPKFDHITPVLFRLHCLPVRYRVTFKILLLVYKALHAKAPAYITCLLKAKSVGRYSLCSNAQDMLVVPKTACKTFGDRAFAKAGSSPWNELLDSIRRASSVETFKNQLKTFLFRKAFYV